MWARLKINEGSFDYQRGLVGFLMSGCRDGFCAEKLLLCRGGEIEGWRFGFWLAGDVSLRQGNAKLKMNIYYEYTKS